MTWRAIVLGLLLGLGISALTYFNDFVAGQTLLIGSFLPISVFGGISLLLLTVNPLLRLGGQRWPLRGNEIAVAVAIGLAACSIPGANLMRYFVSMSVMPAHLIKTKSNWQARSLMSYLPGGSGLLADGFVQDWPALLRAVEAQGRSDLPLESTPPPGRLFKLASDGDRDTWERAWAAPRLEPTQITSLLYAINRVLPDRRLSDEAMELPLAGTSPEVIIGINRAALSEALPRGTILPSPEGGGVLVADGRYEPQITDPLLQGLNTPDLLPFDRVPWSAWWPNIRLWVGLVLCLGTAMLCMALIVHPQWSRRELLQYPIARFIEILGHRDAAHGLPHVARSKLFWWGFAALLAIHGLNGLHAWFPAWPQLPLYFDFNPMRTLFPNASRVAHSYTVFRPVLFLSVAAFAFMLNRSVSFSLGIAQVLFVAVGAKLIANGIAVEYDKFSPNKTNLMRLGAYIGMTLLILYTGRRYYAAVAAAALGLHRAEAPRWAAWAARVMAGLLVISVAFLLSAGMSPLMAVILVAMCVIIWLVTARIVAETGMILLSGPLLPLGALPALMGYEAIGPTQVLLLGIAGFLLVGDPKESLMPYVVNGLRMTDQTGTPPPRVAPWLIAMLLGGAAVAVFVTITLQYQHGLNLVDGYATGTAPGRPFDEAARAVSELSAIGRLDAAMTHDDLGRLANLGPEPWAIAWLLVGLTLVLATAIARLRLPWWPLHPVIFLVWGTWAIAQLGFSFLVGWAIKSAVVGAGGARGYHATLPLMMGIIAGELTAGLFWMAVGATYFLSTGAAPSNYLIFP